MLSASNLSLFSLVEGSGKDICSDRAPKAPGRLVVRMMQSFSQRAGETLTVEKERERPRTRKGESELMKETGHPVRAPKAKAPEMNGRCSEQRPGPST